jgi:hypothetical protein
MTVSRAFPGHARSGALIAGLVLAAAAALGGEELTDRGRKAQAAELDGPALAGNPEALARQLRAVGLRLVCLRRAFVPRFDGRVTAREVVARMAGESGLELAWLEGGVVAVLWHRTTEAARKTIRDSLADKDALVWGPALREAAQTSDLELHRLLLEQSAADGERAAELARTLAELGRLGDVLALNEPRGLALAGRALADKDQAIRRSAVGALAAHGGAEAAKLIGKAAAVSKPEQVEELGLVDVLEEIGGPEAVKALAGLLRQKALAEKAVASLAAIGGPEAAGVLEKALDQESLAEAALGALGEMGGPGAVRALTKTLGNPKLRDHAAELLAEIGGPEARDVLIAQLGKAGADAEFRSAVKEILRLKFADDPKAREAVKKADAADGAAGEGKAPDAVPPAPAPAKPPAKLPAEEF